VVFEQRNLALLLAAAVEAFGRRFGSQGGALGRYADNCRDEDEQSWPDHRPEPLDGTIAGEQLRFSPPDDSAVQDIDRWRQRSDRDIEHCIAAELVPLPGVTP